MGSVPPMWKSLIFLLPIVVFAQEKSVIGLDTRVQVKKLTNPFHKTVGLLSKGRGGFCTATLISPQHIVTNAHCVVRGSKKLPKKLLEPGKLVFIPGMTSLSQRPLGSYRIIRIDTFIEYTKSADPTRDLAILKLDRKIALPIAPRIEVRDPRSVENLPLVIAGYSSKKPMGTMWEGQGITRDANPETNLILHDVDTLPGTSGSLLRVKTSRGWKAIGIHRGPRDQLNDGVYFTPVITRSINRWLQN